MLLFYSVHYISFYFVQFDIEAAENADGNFERIPEEAHFINDGLDADDISQGGLGNFAYNIKIFDPKYR